MRVAPSARSTVVVAAASVGALCLVWLFGLWYFEPWVAHNDFAIFRTRLERLLGGDVSLIGAYSRLGVHHPGPWYEWLFVGPYWLSGRRAAALPATALVLNISWCLVGLYAAWRSRTAWIGPTIVAGLVLVMVAVRNQLDSPWHPNLAVLPMYVACAATALVLAGARRAWIVAVVAASFAAQFHASVPIVAGVLFALVVIGEYARRPSTVWRPVLLAVVLWIGPLLDLLIHGRDANLVRLATTSDGSGRIGARSAFGFASRLLWPPSMLDGAAIEPDGRFLTPASSILIIVVLGVLTIGALRGRGSLRWGATVALAGSLAVLVSIGRFLLPPLPYVFGAMQAVSAFALAVVVMLLVMFGVTTLPALRRSDAAGAPPVSDRVGRACVFGGIAVLLGLAAMTDVDDHESAARRDLGLEAAVVAHLGDHPNWQTVTLVGLDVVAANPMAELTDVLVRRGLDPRSDRVELDLDPPPGGGDAFVIAMGDSLDCLTEVGFVPLAMGTVPSVGGSVALFAIDLDIDDAAVVCGTPAAVSETDL